MHLYLFGVGGVVSFLSPLLFVCDCFPQWVRRLFFPFLFPSFCSFLEFVSLSKSVKAVQSDQHYTNKHAQGKTYNGTNDFIQIQ